MPKSKRRFCADFETVVLEHPKTQKSTAVWAWAFVEIGKTDYEDVIIGNCIETFFDYIFKLNTGIEIYFHNLKFDGSFILDYLHKNKKFRCGYIEKEKRFKTKRELMNNEFTYLISNRNTVWYSISIKHNGRIINIFDSLKLLPFSVEVVAKNFATQRKKGKINYKLHTAPKQPISKDERTYISNDVLVMSEALANFFKGGNTKITIGSNCMNKFKLMFAIMGDFKAYFPDLTEFKIDKNIYGSENADEYCRKSYKGAWCYLVPEKANKIIGDGIVLDVNSLYPSVMHSDSNNYYPTGEPTFWKGNYIPEYMDDKYYILRIKTRFYLKPDKLPCIQIKNNAHYGETEYLTTSDIILNGKYYNKYVDIDDTVKDTRVTLTLTQTDFELIKSQYDLIDFEILDGCYFRSYKGLFDDYINYYADMKMNAPNNAVRTEAKLFLNNLYGKFATSQDSSFKIGKIIDDVLKWTTITEFNRKTIYIPVGSAITAYARYFTITSAQKNYKHFIYADTDSLHCDTSIDNIKDVPIDDKKLNHWKHEFTFKQAIYLRQKRYIEIGEDNEYNIVCAGMGKRCKELLYANLTRKNIKLYNLRERKFMRKKLLLSDIKSGLKIPSKLYQKRIDGGIILYEDYFTMK